MPGLDTRPSLGAASVRALCPRLAPAASVVRPGVSLLSGSFGRLGHLAVCPWQCPLDIGRAHLVRLAVPVMCHFQNFLENFLRTAARRSLSRRSVPRSSCEPRSVAPLNETH